MQHSHRSSCTALRSAIRIKLSDYGPQVKLARLYEKTSKTGNQYFVGRLGMAKVAVLKSKEVAEDGSPMWVVLQTVAS